MIEKIKERIIEIEKAMQSIVAQHAQLVGNLEASKHFLEMAEKESCCKETEAVVEEKIEKLKSQ